ncbi:MAG: hypothetical protein IIC79_01965 [Chloroflexi bacterium]|nr:hypothetical protein [Chloroflexota bacterium]
MGFEDEVAAVEGAEEVKPGGIGGKLAAMLSEEGVEGIPLYSPAPQEPELTPEQEKAKRKLDGFTEALLADYILINKFNVGELPDHLKLENIRYTYDQYLAGIQDGTITIDDVVDLIFGRMDVLVAPEADNLSLEEVNDQLLSVAITGELAIDKTRRPKGADGVYTQEDDKIMLDNMNLIINEAAKYDLDTNQLAYILATVHWESALGGDMAELGSNAYFEENYWGENGEEGKALGNIYRSDAWTYAGRGFVQLTGRANYTYYDDLLNVNILNDPNQILTNPELAAEILLQGMTQGVYTGLVVEINDDETLNVYLIPEDQRKTLFGYNFPEDFEKAREIIGAGAASEIAKIAQAYACMLETLCLTGALPGTIICASGNCAPETS